MTDLSPCPGCDSTLGPFTASPDGRLQVICSTCGLRGPYATMVETAEQRWERLPRPAAPGAQQEIVPCPAMRCGGDSGICGVCGGAEEVTREMADDYVKWRG